MTQLDEPYVVLIPRSRPSADPKSEDSQKPPAEDQSTPPLSASAAEASFNLLLPKLQALPRTQVVPLNFQPRQAALTILGVLHYIEKQQLVAKLELLAKVNLFDMAHYHDLRDLVGATWHLRSQIEKLRPTVHEQQVPLTVLDAALRLRKQMTRVLEFHFAEHALVGPELAVLRTSNGYQDLAADLLSCSTLYDRYENALRGTTAHYRAGDGSLAARLSDQLLDCCGQGRGLNAPTEERVLLNLQLRSAVLLGRSYSEVRAACLFLCRESPHAAEHFPTLSQIGRHAPARKPPKAPPPPAEPQRTIVYKPTKKSSKP